MASETDGNCPICHDTKMYLASALPCHHRFCLGCILRWAHRNPVCPLCRRTIEMIRASDKREGDYLETATAGPEELPDCSSLAGTDPDGLDENSPHPPVASHPSSAQGTLFPLEQEASGLMFVGGLLPEVWADLFRGQQHLLDPVRLWLRQRLRRIYKSWWWLVEATESTILHDLCVSGPNAVVLIERLEPLLEQHTAPLIHGVINIIVGQCSEEAQMLLHSGTLGDENNSPVAIASSSSSGFSNSRFSSSSFSFNSSWEGTPTSGPALETVLYSGPSCPPPLPVLREWDQAQEERGQVMMVAGPSAQGSSHSPSSLALGRDQCPVAYWDNQNKKAPSSQDCL
ncbi:E3 ubiquitin-protein ligase Topors-like protein [Willisornis vidua]|uniref:E3 ubiquitin-protein ligase Topors-like protein n=1 Tax=Willisornis vidua TaxID=1566151 RepID=A0ABQ9DCW9_9PASS|nr:E3 ubiquitin-protein ligase Topors-like protein [Willisornis vidua]